MLFERGPHVATEEVPTLKKFGPRFLEDYAEANRQKPSGVAAKETILRVHLEPLLGDKKLDVPTGFEPPGERFQGSVNRERLQ